jgi:conjugative relaxase-like TrwC/TraI family protein
MLTIKNINAAVAKTYFEKGYYEQGRWFGKGAAQLNLTGEIKDHTPYNNLLDGLSPDGTEPLMGRSVEPEKHRAAIDCTFNAPKSVSLQALVGGDERLIEAHRKAVNQTLELMESRYAQTRIVEKGQPRRVVNTGKMQIAQFDHIETRDLDPHIHTHCVVMNVTPLADGRWRSLHNDAIYRQQKFLGMVYQHNLALEVQKLGYQVVAKGHGQFEIAGYQEKDLESFSKRRQAILAAAGENATVEQRNRAWGNTRVKKENVSPDELKTRWEQEAQELGLNFVTPHQDPVTSPTTITQKTLADAVEHCSERGVAFRQEDLEKFLLDEAQPVALSQLHETIAGHPELIKITEPTETRYTTQSALQRELATIRLMQEGKGQDISILSDDEITKALEPIPLTKGQHGAIATALSTNDQVIAWQGVAGAGKTYALNHFSQLVQAQGYVIKGFAPSAEAAKVLEKEVGIEANTVASLLCSHPPKTIELKQIWIIDEAGLLSAKAAYDLLKRVKSENAKVLLVGDTRQLSAVEAGNPFKSLQSAGMTTAFMNQSLRQRTPELQIAVDLIAKGEIDTGFERLDEANCLQEVAEEEKIAKIVADYLAIPQAEREKTLVLAGTNRERLAITQGIRQGLHREGQLGQSVSLTQLKTKDLTQVQMRYTHHIEIGDLVMPTFNYKKRQLTKGQLYEVIAKDTDSLTLKDQQGNTLTVDPLFEKALYSHSNISIAKGDYLKWTKNNNEKGRRNGQTFQVKVIEGTQAVIESGDGQQDTLDLSQPQHLDYALVSTTYSAQGKTAERVLISADNTIGKESFYVAISRVKSELKLYTTDKENLLELAKNSRAKENPLELLRSQEKVKFQPKAKVLEMRVSGDSQSLDSFGQVVSKSVIETPFPEAQQPNETVSPLTEKLIDERQQEQPPTQSPISINLG